MNGTNCPNCKFFRPSEKLCINPKAIDLHPDLAERHTEYPAINPFHIHNCTFKQELKHDEHIFNCKCSQCFKGLTIE